MNSDKERANAIVLGGGIAGVEATPALNDFAPEQISITLVSADRDFLRFIQASATSVRPHERIVELSHGDELRNDEAIREASRTVTAVAEDGRVRVQRELDA